MGTIDEAPLMISEEEERRILLARKPLTFGQVFTDWQAIAIRLSSSQMIVVAMTKDGISIYSASPLAVNNPYERKIARCNVVGARVLGLQAGVVTKNCLHQELPPFLAS